MKLDDLKLQKGNPRYIKDEKFAKLVNSIKEFPKMMELRPIIYNPVNMEILGGNMRYKALKELGYDNIPENWIKSAQDFTDAEIRRFIITDNNGFGEWDYDLLANDWDAEELEEWGMDIPDFSFEDEEEKEKDEPTEFAFGVKFPIDYKSTFKDVDKIKMANLILNLFQDEQTYISVLKDKVGLDEEEN